MKRTLVRRLDPDLQPRSRAAAERAQGARHDGGGAPAEAGFKHRLLDFSVLPQEGRRGGCGMQRELMPEGEEGGAAPAMEEAESAPAAAEATNAAGKVCPKETITMGQTFCGEKTGSALARLFQRPKFGAVAEYAYPGAEGWYFREYVTSGDGTSYGIRQQKKPRRSRSGILLDDIYDLGRPEDIAPKKIPTYQNIYASPTKNDPNPCLYYHNQVIEVSLTKTDKPRAGKVKTSVDGKSVECSWSE